MNCIIVIVLVLLIYLLYHYIEYNINDKFETQHDNPIAEEFFDKNVQVYVINMSKHQNRMNSMIDQLGKQKIDLIRVEAVVGKEYDREYINNWPNLKGEKYDGTKGIQLSNIKVMKMASLARVSGNAGPPWIIILEDDNKITKNFKEKIYNAIHKYPNTKVFHLDKRWYQYPLINYFSMKKSKMLMGAMAQMYHKDVLPVLIKELDYTTSEYMSKFPASKNREQVFDDYLHWLILTLGIDIKAIPLNKEVGFETTIGGTSVAKGKESYTNISLSLL